MIIQAVLVIFMTSMVISFLMPASYRTNAKILIKRAKQGAVDIGTETIGLPGLSSQIIRTHADVDVNKVMATSKQYIREMVRKLQLRDDNDNFIKTNDLIKTGLLATIMGRMNPKPHITISQYEGTAIMQIIAVSRSSVEAMMMANTLADIMVEQNKNLMGAEYKKARVFLEEQMEKIKLRYNKALLHYTNFQNQEKTIDLQTETKLAAEKMSRLITAKEKDVIELIQLNGKLAHLKTQLDKLSPDFMPGDTLKDSPQIEILKKRTIALHLDHAVAKAEFTEKHPRIRRLKEQISLAEGELRSEIKVYKTTAPQLNALERQIAAVEAHLGGINNDIQEYLKTLGGIPGKALQKETLGLELNVTHQTYKSLLDSLYQIGMAEVSTLSEIQVMDKASMPSVPASPNRVLHAVLGLFVGLMFGVGLAFLLEYLDDTIRSAEDVKEFKPFPLLATVPEFEDRDGGYIAARDPNDPVYESYRTIKNRFSMNEKQPIGTLLITSPGPGEGKSTTAVNLAVAVAREGRKVVMIDMDVRRASLHTCFNLDNDRGITDLLQDNASLEETVQPTYVEGLNVICGGLPYPNPGELVESHQMEGLIKDLRARFDMVIMDSAPLLVKSDALVLARHADGVIVVLESEKTTRGAVHEVMDALAKAHVMPLGFVLNRLFVEKGKHHYHQFYYGHLGREMSVSR